MFVIATAWDNFKYQNSNTTVDVAEHAGQCLKKAVSRLIEDSSITKPLLIYEKILIRSREFP